MMDHFIESIPFNMIHLCIDAYENYIIHGRAYCNTRIEAILFQDISAFIIKADEMFNENGNPLAFEEKRSFQTRNKKSSYQNKPQICCDYRDLQKLEGELATVDIVVVSRKKSSWQGVVYLGTEEYEYCDILDLIRQITAYLTTIEKEQ